MEKKKQKKEEASPTTTYATLQKSDIEKIEQLKKSLKGNNPPLKSKAKSQNEVEPLKKSKVKGQNDERSTTWTFLVYPESAPKDWLDVLKELHVPFIVSPLHDKDINKDTGEIKKAHYHCIVKFKSKKSFKQVKSGICDKLNSPIPQPVVDIAMMVRYLAHLDDPQKYQYNVEDIQVYGNIDVKEYIYDKKDYQFEVLKEILDFCEVYNIQEYSTIVNYCKDERPKWFPFVTKTFRAAVDSYVRSQRYASENGTE